MITSFAEYTPTRHNIETAIIKFIQRAAQAVYSQHQSIDKSPTDIYLFFISKAYNNLPLF